MSVKPITPHEIQDIKNLEIPDSIIESVNELIVKYWNGSSASFKQPELLERVLEKDKTLTSQKIFSEHLFDFEPLFRNQGWVVEYDKPGYNESYEAYFKFSGKRP